MPHGPFCEKLCLLLVIDSRLIYKTNLLTLRVSHTYSFSVAKAS